MAERNSCLARLRWREASSDGTAATIPAAVEAWVREVPLAIISKSLNGGPPRGVNRSVVPCIATATRGPARFVDAAGAVDLIDRRLVRYIKARAWGISGEASDWNDLAALVINSERSCVVAGGNILYQSANAIIE